MVFPGIQKDLVSTHVKFAGDVAAHREDIIGDVVLRIAGKRDAR